MLVSTAVLGAAGAAQLAEGLGLLEAAEIATEAVTPFVVTEAMKDEYRKYLNQILTSYQSDTADSMRDVLERGFAEQLPREKIERELQDIMQSDRWRARRLAVTEVTRTSADGGLKAMHQISDEADVQFEKALQHSSSITPCKFCQAFGSDWKPADTPLFALGDTVTADDGTVYFNDFMDLGAGDIHPQGRGNMVYRVVRS